MIPLKMVLSAVGIFFIALGPVAFLGASAFGSGFTIICQSACGGGSTTTYYSTSTTTTTYLTTTTITVPTTTTVTSTSTSVNGGTVVYTATSTLTSTSTISSTITSAVTSTSTSTQIYGANFYVDGAAVSSNNAYTVNSATLVISASPFVGTPVSYYQVTVTDPSGSASTLKFYPGSSTSYTLSQSGSYKIQGYVFLTTGSSFESLSITGSLSTSQNQQILSHLLITPFDVMLIASEAIGFSLLLIGQFVPLKSGGR